MSDRFELPSELNIYSVLEARDALLAWVSAKAQDPVQVCARNVNEIDGAGLQLLASLSAAGAHWQLVGASQAFEQACRTMGFAQWLDDMPLDADQHPGADLSQAKPKTKSKTKTKTAKESAP